MPRPPIPTIGRMVEAMTDRRHLTLRSDLSVRPHCRDFYTVEMYFETYLPGATCEFVKLQVEARMSLADLKRHADLLAAQLGYPKPIALYVGPSDTVPPNQVHQ